MPAGVIPIHVDVTLSGSICHDGTYVYLELVDDTDPKKLNVSPQIACFDDWELIIARQRAQPFRQYMIGPTALTQGLSYGEVNWRQGVKATEYIERHSRNQKDCLQNNLQQNDFRKILSTESF